MSILNNKPFLQEELMKVKLFSLSSEELLQIKSLFALQGFTNMGMVNYMPQAILDQKYFLRSYCETIR